MANTLVSISISHRSTRHIHISTDTYIHRRIWTCTFVVVHGFRSTIGHQCFIDIRYVLGTPFTYIIKWQVTSVRLMWSLKKVYRANYQDVVSAIHILLTWINFNPSMNKQLHVPKSGGWNYLSIHKLQRLHHWSLGMDLNFNGCTIEI